jgi:hypothetical protein
MSEPVTQTKPAGHEVMAAQPRTMQENSQIEELLRGTPPGESVRVIVQLRIPPGPDADREQRIKSAQEALLAELARVPHKIIRSYSSTPAMALEASRQALEVLRDSPQVLSVHEDQMLKPLNKPGLTPP